MGLGNLIDFEDFIESEGCKTEFVNRYGVAEPESQECIYDDESEEMQI